MTVEYTEAGNAGEKQVLGTMRGSVWILLCLGQAQSIHGGISGLDRYIWSLGKEGRIQFRESSANWSGWFNWDLALPRTPCFPYPITLTPLGWRWVGSSLGFIVFSRALSLPPSSKTLRSFEAHTINDSDEGAWGGLRTNCKLAQPPHQVGCVWYSCPRTEEMANWQRSQSSRTWAYKYLSLQIY